MACQSCIYLRRKSHFKFTLNGLLSLGLVTQNLRKSLSIAKVCVRRFSSGEVGFPWTQQLADVYGRDPFLHRLVGGLSLARSLRNVPDGTLDIKEFLQSAKVCILLCSKLMSTLDSDNTLENLLSRTLYRNTRKALDQLHVSTAAEELQLHLDVQKVRNLSIAGIRSVVGPEETDSDHVSVDFLGQQCVTSSTEIEPILNEISSFSMQQCRSIARTAFQKGFRFQVDVKFMSRERFYISRRLPTGLDDVICGSKDTVSCVHLWQFQSPFDWEQFSRGEFPLSWVVSDIDRFVRYNVPQPRKMKAFF